MTRRVAALTTSSVQESNLALLLFSFYFFLCLFSIFMRLAKQTILYVQIACYLRFYNSNVIFNVSETLCLQVSTGMSTEALYISFILSYGFEP